ncbi:hypothetical protein VPHK567_0379 [Vibrio phage K567]
MSFIPRLQDLRYQLSMGFEPTDVSCIERNFKLL